VPGDGDVRGGLQGLDLRREVALEGRQDPDDAERAGAAEDEPLRARQALGRPKSCKLAHAFMWELPGIQLKKRLELARLLGQLGVFLTWSSHCARIQLRGRPASPPSGSAELPTDCMLWPRDQVR
jgi:hypothetical protein